MIISLTERGSDVAAVVRHAVEHVDAALAASLGADGVADLRRVLGGFVDLDIAPQTT